MAQAPSLSIKAPEGRFQLVSAPGGSVMFNHKSPGTRMTLAQLRNGAEEGLYIINNVREYLHISPYRRTGSPPLRSLMFNPSAVRNGHPTCHAFHAAKDGVDTIVGIGNGEVLLLSLRAQLQGQQGNPKAAIAATLNADNAHNDHKCVAVTWIPRSNGAQFLAAHADGTILVYKKTAGMVGEGAGKLLSQISSKGSALAPVHSIQVAGGGIADVAFSPCGNRLAVACRDGGCRLLEWPGGSCVGGFFGYYGGLLCCCWSPDGQYVATGGEDDLITIYSVADRQQMAFGEGHNSWTSRVAFDPWQQQESTGEDGTVTKTYRLGSVGHDLQLCLWDLTIEEDADAGLQQRETGPGPAHGLGRMKRVASATQGGLQAMGSTSNISSVTGHADASVSSHGGTLSEGGGLGGHASTSSMTRQGSNNLTSASMQRFGGAGTASGSPLLVPSVPLAEMVIIQPLVCARVHPEPLFDLLFTEDALFTSCGGGQIRCWVRHAWAAKYAAAEQQGYTRR